MRIVTWNMAFWSNRSEHDSAWRWALSVLEPDVFLCQECVLPSWLSAEWTSLWYRAYPETLNRQQWGTGIVTRLPCRGARIPDLDAWFDSLPAKSPGKDELARIHKADGWLACGEVEIPGVGPWLVASVHSPSFPIEKARWKEIGAGHMKLKNNPDLWFTDVLFHHARPLLGRGVVLGGDLNSSRAFDKPNQDRGNNEFFDRIAEEGFVSLHRKFHDADEQTFFKKGCGPCQIDYLFADQPIAKLVTRCYVHSFDEVSQFSDHAPLVVDLLVNT